MNRKLWSVPGQQEETAPPCAIVSALRSTSASRSLPSRQPGGHRSWSKSGLAIYRLSRRGSWCWTKARDEGCWMTFDQREWDLIDGAVESAATRIDEELEQLAAPAAERNGPNGAGPACAQAKRDAPGVAEVVGSRERAHQAATDFEDHQRRAGGRQSGAYGVIRRVSHTDQDGLQDPARDITVEAITITRTTVVTRRTFTN